MTPCPTMSSIPPSCVTLSHYVIHYSVLCHCFTVSLSLHHVSLCHTMSFITLSCVTVSPCHYHSIMCHSVTLCHSLLSLVSLFHCVIITPSCVTLSHYVIHYSVLYHCFTVSLSLHHVSLCHTMSFITQSCVTVFHHVVITPSCVTMSHLFPQPSKLSLGSWQEVRKEDAEAVKWVPDHAAVNCMRCHATFSLLRRKHHCRCVWCVCGVWCVCVWCVCVCVCVVMFFMLHVCSGVVVVSSALLVRATLCRWSHSCWLIQ